MPELKLKVEVCVFLGHCDLADKHLLGRKVASGLELRSSLFLVLHGYDGNGQVQRLQK